MSAVSISKAEVPAYLVGSDFYNSPSSDDDERFSIPSTHLKMTTEIHNPEDLSHLLHTLRFWGLSSWPSEVFAYLSTKKDRNVTARIEEVLREFDDDVHLSQLFPELQQATSPNLQLDAAVKCGRKDVIEYFLRFEQVGNGMFVETAAENGLVDLLKSKFEELNAKSVKIPLYMVSLSAVATVGHADCLHFLLTNGCKAASTVCLAAAKNGHLDCLKVAQGLGCSWDGHVTSFAAQNGHLKCLEFALREGCPIGAGAAQSATKNKHMKCLELLVNSGAAKAKNVSCAAASNGDLSCLLFLAKHNYPVDVGCAREAARYGHLECLKYLIDNRSCPINSTVVDAAASGAHLDCLEYLHTTCGQRASSKGLRAAAEGGYLDVLKYLHMQGVALTFETCDGAVRTRHKSCLKFCVEHNAPLHASLCAAAVSKSSLGREVVEDVDMLRYLHEVAHCPWNASTCTAAAGRNRLDLLMYAHNNGCPWDASTCTAAVSFNRSLECLKYAHENGCPWDINTTNTAAFSSSFLGYMLQHGCPINEMTCAAVAQAGNLACMRLLHERGCPWDERVSRAARGYHGNVQYECLRYCVENGCPIDRKTMDAYNEHKERNGCV